MNGNEQRQRPCHATAFAVAFMSGGAVVDFSVCGIDRVEASRWPRHCIASIDQPIERMAKAAVGMMVLRIEDKDLPAGRRLFPGRLQRGTWVAR